MVAALHMDKLISSTRFCVRHVAWALAQVDDAGNVLGGIGGLHESVLETDPTGREMRPRVEG